MNLLRCHTRRPWRRLWSPAVGLALTGLLSSCGPSYTRNHLAPDLQDLCAKEYHLPVRAQLFGHDLTVICTIAGLLKSSGGQVEFAPSQHANEQLGNIVEALHRVTLSADWPIEFYAIVATDPTVPGAWLMLVRCLEDVRRVYASAIPTMEFFQRTILNLQYDPVRPPDTERLALRDMTLEQFLTLQMGKRLQNVLRADPQSQVAYEVGTCVGQFKQGTFQFVVEVAPRSGGPELTDHETSTIFEEALGVIASVLRDYHFDAFIDVQLLHFPSGKTMGVPKTRLWTFLPAP